MRICTLAPALPVRAAATCVCTEFATLCSKSKAKCQGAGMGGDRGPPHFSILVLVGDTDKPENPPAVDGLNAVRKT